MRAALLALALLSFPALAQREMLDDVGRYVVVPERVERVYAAGPPAAVLVFAIDPEKLLGWTRAFRPEEAQFLPEKYRDLPEVGRLTGRGNTANVEVLLKARPDLVVAQFWHIPWPNPETFRVCPWAEPILHGLLGRKLLPGEPGKLFEQPQAVVSRRGDDLPGNDSGSGQVQLSGLAGHGPQLSGTALVVDPHLVDALFRPGDRSRALAARGRTRWS